MPGSTLHPPLSYFIHDIPLLFLSSHTECAIVDKTEDINFYGYVIKDSGFIILDASIKMAFRLHEAYVNLKKQKIEDNGIGMPKDFDINEIDLVPEADQYS